MVSACEVPTRTYPDGRTGTAAGWRAHKTADEPSCEPCRLARNAATKAWKQQNRDKQNSYNRKYRLHNKDMISSYKKEYYLKNKDRVSASNKKYYRNNKERHQKQTKEWRAANPKKHAEHRARWKAKRRALRNSNDLIPAKPRVTEDDRCACCGSFTNLQVDHIVPISKGGYFDEPNTQPLCDTCNLSKSNGDWCLEHRRFLGARAVTQVSDQSLRGRECV